eukprot:TRINITY_DN9950_c0_g2_i1.p1 TRINITY_DN9950_c0_g2~~TRINITY_DN9950_c0_g2_i1.p1  ORF type:complete len:732 (-),score=108.41 TRINITY_DN9950_c0_g2_i1:136-2331(-)
MVSRRLVSLLLPPAVHGCLVDPGTPVYTMGRSSVRAASTATDSQLEAFEELFLAVPSNDSARASLKHITSKPHVAGTDGDLEMARYVQARLLEAGIPEAEIDPQRSLLAYPVNRSLTLVDSEGRVLSKASLSEELISSDRTTDTWWRNHTFNGYSPSGNVEARVVYANYGFPEDFAALEEAGVSVKGAIALMRYGKCFRGLKAKNAQEAGAVAALIYSDPADDGFAQGSVYPNGPWRPPTSVQRGSIQFISTCAGDPARAYAPHGRSVEEVCGYSQDELIPKIPVLPMSYSDATPFLESLGGPEVPPAFRGALNLTYRFGPSAEGAKAVLHVHNRFQKSPVWNVIAKIPGSLAADVDQPILLGNHRDAWVYGAADPNSGTAQLLEVARGLGKLLKKGWRPLRTIVLCSWSGEEYGLLGSTAWAEVHGDDDSGALATKGGLSRALAYLNVDTGVSGNAFRASGTPTLGRVLAGALGQVKDPRSGTALSELWDDGDLFALGSGSDYTAFIDHLGIPSLDMYFGPSNNAPYGVYHSVYDSFHWMDTEGDPGFHYHVAMAQVWGLVALRLAGLQERPFAPLPFNVSLQAEAISGYIQDARAAIEAAKGPQMNFAEIDAAQAKYAAAAKTIMERASAAAAAGKQAAVQALNERLAGVERQFLTIEGLPKRKWFRHVLQGPGLHTGYAAKTLPGVDDAVSAADWARAQSQLNVAARRIAAAAAFLLEEGDAEVPLVV